MSKLRILYDLIMGFFFKFKAWICIICNIKPKTSCKRAGNTIVSLTSYGDRLSRCTSYAIYSMFTQSVTPEKITLWIDKKKWNDKNIPFAIQRMKGWGMLEINYCEDIRSYTKLIPALKKYPNKIIITVDDDLYYSKHVVKQLYESYLNNKKNIHTFGVSIPNYINNKLSPYKNWNNYFYYSDILINNNSNALALGFCGILYPPSIFDQEIFNKSVYMNYSSSADDIWFYIMSLRLNIGKTLVNSSNIHFYLIDLIYQKTHIKSNLREINEIKSNANDISLSRLLQYYNLNIAIQ